jgi:membrane protease YdiL (CAAX protease family)
MLARSCSFCSYAFPGRPDNLRLCSGKCSYRLMPWDFWVIFLILSVFIPWRGRMRLRRLLAEPVMGSKEKLVLYGSTIAFQWALCGIVAWRSFARGLTSAQLGVEHRVSLEILLAGVVGGAVLATFQWFNLRRISRMKGPAPELMRKLAARLLPGKSVELAPYCALAATAGVCEEFLYRGFAMAALSRVGIAAWGVICITSVLFGLAHAYQGKSGIVGTTLMGFLFGVGRIGFGSLLPVMIWHAALDLSAGVAGPRYLAWAEADITQGSPNT